MRDQPPSYLFNQFDAHSVQQSQRESLRKDIASYDGARLLNTNVDDLVSYFVEKYRVDVPTLLEGGISADHREAQRNVSGDPRRMAHRLGLGPVYVTGTEITVEVPFDGDANLFHIRPSTFNTMPPQGRLSNNNLVFTMWGDNLQQEQVQSGLQAWLASIKQYLQWHEDTFRGFNTGLQQEARQAVDQRRTKILRDQNLMAGLGIALKRKPGEPGTYTAPEVRRKITPKMPPATPGNFKPEPVLEEAEYQHILSIIETMAKTMERDPDAFRAANEENLRTMFLVPLNSHYEGHASGETFNYNGKTDILIRSVDRNVFIAECKFWGGPAVLMETIDQLLGYLSWRDSKAAIILFNRNRNFSRVLETIPSVMVSHPNFQKSEGMQGSTRFRYAFHHRDDPAKVLHITVMAFDVPR
jgi:hypothetical protein